MTYPEDGFHGNEAFHPEFRTEALETMPPKQETLATILNHIDQLAMHESAREMQGSSIGRIMSMKEKNPDSASGRSNYLNISRIVFSEIAELAQIVDDIPPVLANITLSELYGAGNKIETRYDIFDMNNELQMEKHVRRVVNPIFPISRYLPQMTLQRLVMERESQLERQQAEAKENELGLNIVSEADAQAIVKMLTEDFVPNGNKGFQNRR